MKIKHSLLIKEMLGTGKVVINIDININININQNRFFSCALDESKFITVTANNCSNIFLINKIIFIFHNYIKKKKAKKGNSLISSTIED